MRDALKPGGVLLLTVPQHPWLWSPIDDFSCHKRRYSATDLEGKLRSAGFSTLRSTSFTSCLLPALVASRLIHRLRPEMPVTPGAEFRIPGWLNWLFEQIMAVEMALIRAGLNFPLGGSRFTISRKIEG